MIYIQQSSTNNIFVNVSEYKTLSNPKYLWRLQNSQGRNIVAFYPENITSTYPSMYANKYDVFTFNTYKNQPENYNFTGGSACNIWLENENQYWLGIYEAPSGSTSFQPTGEKLLTSLAFVFVETENEFYTGNTANFEPNKIYYKNGNGITPTPSNTPANTPTNTPTPSITPSITPTNTPTSTIAATPTPTPTPSITPSITPTSTNIPTSTPTTTPTNTPTSSLTPTPTISLTPSITPTLTPTNTPTSSLTPTPTISLTPTITPTITLTPTPSSSPVLSGTAEANAYLTAVVNNGGTIDSTISAATRTLFTSLVSNNLYNKMLAMYPLIGGVANSAKLNAVNVGTYDITWNGGMSFTTTGATSNGTNGFGDTGIVYSSLSSYYLNGSYGVQFHNNLPGGVQCPMGAGPSNSSRVLFFSTNDGIDNQVFFDWGSDSGLNRAEVTGTGVRGLYIISSPTTSSQTAYRNGTALSPSGGAGNKNNAPTSSMLLFRRQDGFYYPGTESFAFVGAGLTAGEVSTLSGIINTYQTSLGRNLY